VFIVDDQPLLVDHLTMLINHQPLLTVCGSAGDRDGVLRGVDEFKPDLVILELQLRHHNGLELLRDLLRRDPKLHILVLTTLEQLDLVERAFAVGGMGYITKYETSAAFLAAVNTVLAGQCYCSEALARQLVNRRAGNRAGAIATEKLTDREFQVLWNIGQGDHNHQIAKRLHVSVRTVETYRGRMMEKLHLDSADDLRKFAIGYAHSQRSV